MVDLSNLQRQVVHTTDRVGERKVKSARKTINALNPDVTVVAHEEMLVAENVERIIRGYDVILDGTDTFETRYILNDAAVAAGIPVVHASVFRFEGQLTTFIPYEGPCYRCLYPTPPPPDSLRAAPWPACSASCRGSWACSRPTRSSRCCSGLARRSPAGCSCSTRSSPSFTELKLRRDPNCPVCSTRPWRHAGRAGR